MGLLDGVAIGKDGQVEEQAKYTTISPQLMLPP